MDFVGHAIQLKLFDKALGLNKTGVFVFQVFSDSSFGPWSNSAGWPRRSCSMFPLDPSSYYEVRGRTFLLAVSAADNSTN